MAFVTDLSGASALVTGASRGIGYAIADRLEAAGALVACLARSFEPRKTESRVEIPCDVTSEGDVRQAVQQVLATFGVPRIVVNNAGAFLIKPLAETSEHEILGQIGVNVIGPFLVLRELLPHLVTRGNAHVVTIGSVADHQPLPGNAAYGASKYGVRGLHEVLAEEVRGKGIRTTLISPGATDTRLWDVLDPDARDDLPARSDMLLPVDVAEAVLYAVAQPPRVSVDWIRLMPAS
jgi:NAD(P)-dependent dehydrogenase (short-subunit alcohol dehydrogenase family)